MLRHLVRIALLRLGQPVQNLVDLASLELAELLDSADTRLFFDLDREFRRDVRELEELGRRGMHGLKEELLQVDDGDVGREPVVGERNRGETGAERQSDRGGEVLFCRESAVVIRALSKVQ